MMIRLEERVTSLPYDPHVAWLRATDGLDLELCIFHGSVVAPFNRRTFRRSFRICQSQHEYPKSTHFARKVRDCLAHQKDRKVRIFVACSSHVRAKVMRDWKLEKNEAKFIPVEPENCESDRINAMNYVM